MKVDEQSVFRHRGERKVKTLEEDIDAVSSTTAELLQEEGEELIGSEHGTTALIYCVCKSCIQVSQLDSAACCR